jgi:acylphosphatase
MDPGVFAAFQASKHVSVQNGGSQFLFKASSVRRRSKAQILEDKAAEGTKKQRMEKMEAEMKEKLAAWAEMEEALEQSETQRLKSNSQLESFKDIYDAGFIKKGGDGQMQIVIDGNEHEHLKAKRSKPKRRGNVDPHLMNLSDVDLDLQEGDLE